MTPHQSWDGTSEVDEWHLQYTHVLKRITFRTLQCVLVMGLGSGRSGTQSLANLLNNWPQSPPGANGKRSALQNVAVVTDNLPVGIRPQNHVRSASGGEGH